MSADDYIVKKIDFTDLSDKAKAAYFKALYALHAPDMENHKDVGNKAQENSQEAQSGRFILTDRELGTDQASRILGSDGSLLVRHPKRGL